MFRVKADRERQRQFQFGQQQRQFAQNFALQQGGFGGFNGRGGIQGQGGGVPFSQRLNNSNRRNNQAEINRFRGLQRNANAFSRGFGVF